MHDPWYPKHPTCLLLRCGIVLALTLSMDRPSPPPIVFTCLPALLVAGMLATGHAQKPTGSSSSAGNGPRASTAAKQIAIHADDTRIKLAFSSYSGKLAEAVRGLLKEHPAGVCPIDVTVYLQLTYPARFFEVSERRRPF